MAIHGSGNFAQPLSITLRDDNKWPNHFIGAKLSPDEKLAIANQVVELLGEKRDNDWAIARVLGMKYGDYTGLKSYIKRKG